MPSDPPAPRTTRAEALDLARALRFAGAGPWTQARTLQGLGLGLEATVDTVLALAADGRERVAHLWELVPLLDRHPLIVAGLLGRHRIPPRNFVFGVPSKDLALRWMRRLGLIFDLGPLVDGTHPHGLLLHTVKGLERLPEDFQVAWDLHLEACHDLLELGPGVRVGGLRLSRCSRLRRLPADLRCGSLKVWQCAAFEGPQGAPGIEGPIEIEDCPALDMAAEQGPVLQGLRIRACDGPVALPRGLRILGDLALTACPGLQVLPPGLTVGGSLRIKTCQDFRDLPDGLRAGETLDLSHLPRLRSLPPDLALGGGLGIHFCPGLTSLPPGLTVPGSLDLTHCPNLEALPEDLRVTGRVKLSFLDSLRTLPPALQRHPDLHISNCPHLNP